MSNAEPLEFDLAQPSLLTSPHMKSEVKTKFRNGEGPNVFALGLAGRPIKGSFGVRPCRLVGWC